MPPPPRESNYLSPPASEPEDAEPLVALVPRPSAAKLKPVWLGRFHVTGDRENPHLRGRRAASLWLAARVEHPEELNRLAVDALAQQGLAITRTETLEQVTDDSDRPRKVQRLLWDARRNPNAVFYGGFEGLEDHFVAGSNLLEVKTDRLLLRPWQQRDREPFAQMNADRHVMEFELAPLPVHRSNDMVDGYLAGLRNFGFDLLAAELRPNGSRTTGVFAGMMGIRVMPVVLPRLQQPAIEIVWRLPRAHHRQGLAFEAGKALLALACNQFQFPEVFAMAAAANAPARGLMEKLGMEQRPEYDCTDPLFPSRHIYRQRVVYRYANPNP